MLASQRIESVVGIWFWVDDTSPANEQYDTEAPTKRGATPSVIEWMILAWVSGKFVCVSWNRSIYHAVSSFCPHTSFVSTQCRFNMERSEAIVGHWPAGICERYVECH